MKNVKILDSTLRDGGYCNDWNFGFDVILRIISNLVDSNVDLIEVGLLSASGKTSVNNTKYFNASVCNKVLSKANLKVELKRKFVCLINHNDYNVNNLPAVEQAGFEGIRYTFHRKDLKDIQYCLKTILGKGYKVYLQPMYTSRYSYDELRFLVDITKSEKLYALYIVDSFGSLMEEDFIQLLMYFDRFIPNEMCIGFHAHDNLNQAFSLSSKMISMDIKHDVIVDASLGGMGRGAGNLSLRSICDYYNSFIGNKYNTMRIENMEKEIMNKFYKISSWGRNPYLFLSALYNVHPNYAIICKNNGIDLIETERFFLRMEDKNKELYNLEYAKSALGI